MRRLNDKSQSMLADLIVAFGGLLMQRITETCQSRITRHTLSSLVFAELPCHLIKLCAFTEFRKGLFLLGVLFALIGGT